MAVLFWITGASFLGAWIIALCGAYRAWWRKCPWFIAWLAAESIQAALILLAGRYPSNWWWWHVWVAAEALAMGTLVMAISRITVPFFAVLSVTASLTRLLFPFAERPDRAPMYFQRFLLFREWLWLLLALSSTIWLGLMLISPPRRHGFYKGGWLLTLLMWFHAAIAPVLATNGPRWLSAQMLYRLLAIAICLRWFALSRRPQLSPPVSGGPLGGGGGVVVSELTATCSSGPTSFAHSLTLSARSGLPHPR